MVLEIVTLGVIGATYISGDKERKEKMKTIGHDIVDVTKETVFTCGRGINAMCNKIKEKREAKKNTYYYDGE